jgi:hypothetical protein
MREDMYKVIVERPRKGGRSDSSEARIYRASEDVNSKIGIKKGLRHRKSLNENLSPLKRWLQAQVNRPWDQVYSELSANIDRRNTVQEHIYAHLDQLVERQTWLAGGKVIALGGWPKLFRPIEQSYAKLYVHPVSGILRCNEGAASWRRDRDELRNQTIVKAQAVCRELSATEHLHCIEHIWYHVTLLNVEGDISVVKKRQLSKAQLKRYQLSNQTLLVEDKKAGDSRLFYCALSLLLPFNLLGELFLFFRSIHVWIPTTKAIAHHICHITSTGWIKIRKAIGAAAWIAVTPLFRH